MLKPLLIAILIYVVSAIAFTIYCAVARTIGAVTVPLLLFIFLWIGLRWALIPTALYLVYEFIVKRT